MGIRCMALWIQMDEKDKYDAEPNGAFMMQGSFEIEAPVDITIKAGQSIGIAIRRNRNKTENKQPDYYGEFYTKKERS